MALRMVFLGLALFRGKLPEHLHLVGVQPDDLSIGVELSACVAEALPQVLERAEKVLRAWELIP